MISVLNLSWQFYLWLFFIWISLPVPLNKNLFSFVDPDPLAQICGFRNTDYSFKYFFILQCQYCRLCPTQPRACAWARGAGRRGGRLGSVLPQHRPTQRRAAEDRGGPGHGRPLRHQDQVYWDASLQCFGTGSRIHHCSPDVLALEQWRWQCDVSLPCIIEYYMQGFGSGSGIFSRIRIQG